MTSWRETETPKPASKPVIDLKKAAVGAFAALTIGSSVLSTPLPAVAVDTFSFSSTNIIAEKVVRQGMYQDYTVDIDQKYDDARSTFKDAKETKSKKGKFEDFMLFKSAWSLFCASCIRCYFTVGKYTAILAILVVGSFIIPMAQYFWYVRDDDSSEKFFEPEPEPKKKKWF
jgi:hypothetical protein